MDILATNMSLQISLLKCSVFALWKWAGDFAFEGASVSSTSEFYLGDVRRVIMHLQVSFQIEGPAGGHFAFITKLERQDT